MSTMYLCYNKLSTSKYSFFYICFRKYSLEVVICLITNDIYKSSWQKGAFNYYYKAMKLFVIWKFYSFAIFIQVQVQFCVIVWSVSLFCIFRFFFIFLINLCIFVSICLSECTCTCTCQLLEAVDVFPYLGSIIAANSSLDPEIKRRIAKAAGTMARLSKRVWENKKLTTATKMKVYQSCVISTLLYGSESWATYST